MGEGTATGMTRRERLRAATVDEILGTARQLLVDQGPEGTSLRAIAREIGMTAPGLYRYFPSHEALLEALCDQLKWELFGVLEAARDAKPDTEVMPRLLAVQRAFRGWAIGHPAEFSLVFAHVRPVADPAVPDHEMALRFGRVFLELLVRLWRERQFPVRDDADFPPRLRDQLERFVAAVGEPLPLGLAYIFLAGWVRLYGMVALEVFGHLGFALTDVEPMFEREINQFAAEIASGTA